MADNKHRPTPLEPPPSYEASEGKPGGASPAQRSPRPRLPLPLNLPALNIVRGKRVVLASQSPRRKQLLAQIGLTDVEIIPSTFAEDLSKTLSPLEYVLQTASKKAMDVYEREINNTVKGEPTLIIAADTIVVGHYGDILGKPKSEKDHIEMLRRLRDGGEHKVYTAVSCMTPLESAREPGYAMETHVEETLVRFDPSVTDDLILAYVKTREGVDKAGGYGIQGIGSILVERIEGTFDNVVGLPLRATLQLIEKVMTPEEDEYDRAIREDDDE
ncbi:Maf-like protein-domain-containing protein [Lineolata rhizophorae]|uniref:Maf-like protein-domain-containing protein n=1 Tax=Lineolata rhizophorae TaxID=578093 RepID=A0A6A6P289_9PEZI|nr:Maf-like protein-domain-containing protein [Lineolata rhizophorae]